MEYGAALFTRRRWNVLIVMEAVASAAPPQKMLQRSNEIPISPFMPQLLNCGRPTMDMQVTQGRSRTGSAAGRDYGRVPELRNFGSNPGRLNAWFYAPEDGAKALPLVVVLHGCTQTAREYDSGSGWSQLAETYGFAVLFPEQRRSNNANLCFSWFNPADTGRGGGEALSIAQMIEALVEHRTVDGERVFITGLSAGGAMTSAMLAAYPEKFAGGAILAGLPLGAPANVLEALQQMRIHTPSSRTSGSAIHEASGHSGRWPTVSIWHGTEDAVVDQSNADAILRQWREVHGLADSPTETSLVDGHPRRAWRDASGKLLIEEYRVTGMGHGTPLSTIGECGCGEAGSFMLEVGISSTIHSAKTWGLLAERSRAATPAVMKRSDEREQVPHPQASFSGIIEDALRAAGLIHLSQQQCELPGEIFDVLQPLDGTRA